MSTAMRRFISLSEINAINKVVDVVVGQTLSRLSERNCEEGRIAKEVELFVKYRERQEAHSHADGGLIINIFFKIGPTPAN